MADRIEAGLAGTLNDEFRLQSPFYGVNANIVAHTAIVDKPDFVHGGNDASHFAGLNKNVDVGTGVITFSHHDKGALNYVTSYIALYDIQPELTDDGHAMAVHDLNDGTLDVIMAAWGHYQNGTPLKEAMNAVIDPAQPRAVDTLFPKLDYFG